MGKHSYSVHASEKRKKQFAHYLNDNEEMLVFTTISDHYLIHKFVSHFLIVSLITVPVLYLVHRIFNYGFYQTLTTALVLALIYACQRYYFTKEGIQYILTNRRLIIQKGYFHVTLNSVSYNKITHSEVIQGVLDRHLYKYGKIIIRTAGSEQKSIILNHVSEPLMFKNVLEKFIAEEKQRYGHSSV